jgi:hypothetical protein
MVSRRSPAVLCCAVLLVSLVSLVSALSWVVELVGGECAKDRRMRSWRGRRELLKRAREEKVAAWTGESITARAEAVLRLAVGGVKVKSEVKLGKLEAAVVDVVIPRPRIRFCCSKVRGRCMIRCR